MHPILINWGSIVVPSWHACYALGAFAAYALLLYLGRLHASHISSRDLSRLFVVCYIAGYFGARFLSILIEEDVSGPEATLAALFRFGPMTFYGGAIAAFLAGLLYARMRHLPLGTLLDLSLPAGLLALAIGRLGCFLNGDDYGRGLGLPPGASPPFWAVTFPNLNDGIPRYPVQLMEMAAVLAVVVLLCRKFVRLRLAFRPGVVGYFAIITYANLRFLLEFLRDDFRGFAFGTWLSTSQFISLVILAAAGLSLPFWLRTREELP